MKSVSASVENGSSASAPEHGQHVEQLDIAIHDGQIVALEKNLPSEAPEVIDASGLHIFPGLIDSHVHFNDPGRADWEGIRTGSSALAAGGGTMFFDMPLNAHPPTVDAESFRLKQRVAEANSVTDFAFWGGIIPTNLDQLEELADCGVIGFKAFMSNSGIDDFPCVDEATLREGMARAAKLGVLVAVHAEDELITRELSIEKSVHHQTSARDYLASRPIAAEVQAIRRALRLAEETGCSLHIVHVSCAEGVALVAEARVRGVDATCETCPHYLSLTDADVERLGAVAKCAPPLRSASEQQKLWDHVVAGNISTIGSDHSPAPPGIKAGDDFFKIWGGISGIQHTLPLLLSADRMANIEMIGLIAQLTSFNVAQRFRLPRQKGVFQIGADADMALVDVGKPFAVTKEGLFYRHKQSPYIGRTLRGVTVRTLLRGKTIYHDGKIVAKAAGRLVKPCQ